MNRNWSWIIGAVLLLVLVGKCSGGDSTPDASATATPSVAVTEAVVDEPILSDTPTVDPLSEDRTLATVSGTCVAATGGWLKILKALQKENDLAFMDVTMKASNKLKALEAPLEQTSSAGLFEWVQSLREAEANMVSVVVDIYDNKATTDDLSQAIQTATDIQEAGYVKYCG